MVHGEEMGFHDSRGGVFFVEFIQEGVVVPEDGGGAVDHGDILAGV